MERTLEETLDERFDALKTMVAAWSKQTVAMATHFSDRDPSEAAKLDLMLVRAIFSKWSIEILTILYTQKSIGFEELRKALKGISSRVLSRKLRIMESTGVIERTILNARPPRVHYALSEEGLTVATLGEPVILYLRFIEGLRLPRTSSELLLLTAKARRC